MNRAQMDAAIRASKSAQFPLMAEWGDGQWSVTAHDTAAFIAGMRAAAEIADQALFCSAADDIKRAADSLEEP